MRKVCGLSLVVLLFTIFVNAYAAPVGNLAEPKMLEEGIFISEDGLVSVRAGYQGDFVFDRRLKDLDDAEINTNAGTVTLNINKKIDVYGIFGATDGTFEETYGSTKVKYETDTAFSWGVGAKAILFEHKDTVIGLDGKYFNAEPDLDKVTINGVSYDKASLGITDAKVEYDEYQIALGVAQKINMFVPYGGVKYSRAKGKATVTYSGTKYESDDAKNKDDIGLFIGCSILPLKNISLNVEGRFLDEEALMVSGQIRF